MYVKNCEIVKYGDVGGGNKMGFVGCYFNIIMTF